VKKDIAAARARSRPQLRRLRRQTGGQVRVRSRTVHEQEDRPGDSAAPTPPTPTAKETPKPGRPGPSPNAQPRRIQGHAQRRRTAKPALPQVGTAVTPPAGKTRRRSGARAVAAGPAGAAGGRLSEAIQLAGRPRHEAEPRLERRPPDKVVADVQKAVMSKGPGALRPWRRSRRRTKTRRRCCGAAVSCWPRATSTRRRRSATRPCRSGAGREGQ
jgi:hypothetical protein